MALHTAGLPVGPDRCERMARAVMVMNASSLAELRACALATMVSDPSQLPTFDRVFAAIFGGPSPFGAQLPPVLPAFPRPGSDGASPPPSSSAETGGWTSGTQIARGRLAVRRGACPEAPALRQVASADRAAAQP